MDPEEKRDQLADFLREQAEEGAVYWKSRQIAEELELSAKEVGVLLEQLQQADTELEIEKWSRSRGAWTWRVRLDS